MEAVFLCSFDTQKTGPESEYRLCLYLVVGLISLLSG